MSDLLREEDIELKLAHARQLKAMTSAKVKTAAVDALTLAHPTSRSPSGAAVRDTAFQRYRETGTLIEHLTHAIPAGTNRLSSLTENAGTSAETWDAEAGSFTYDANGNLKTSPAPHVTWGAPH